jgi:protein subunit release factor A
MSENEIWGRLSGLEARLGAVDDKFGQMERQLTRVETLIETQLASREWVRELVNPLTEATREMRHAVEVLGRDNQMLNAAHNKLLEERSRREQEEHEAKLKALREQTWAHILKEKWAPIGAFILTCASVLALVGKLAEIYLAARGYRF